MNRLEARICDIQTSSGLSLVSLELGSCSLQAIIIENPETVEYLRVGNTVFALFNETEVILSSESHEKLSLRNQIPCTVKDVDRGEMLARICLDFEGRELRSVITSAAAAELALQPGMAEWAMINTNEIMLSDQ